MKKLSKKQASTKETYHEEIIVKPAKKLLAALQETQTDYTPAKPKIKKSATSR